jgi:hypothetical protein
LVRLDSLDLSASLRIARLWILKQVQDDESARPFSEPSGRARFSPSQTKRESTMRWSHGAIAVAALLAPVAGQAQLVKQDFCNGLKTVVNAARNEGGFLHLERARAAPPHLGFRHGCRATGDEKRQYWLCHQNLAPAEMSRAALAARVAQCLPEAVRSTSDYGHEATFTLPHAQIRIHERGGPGAKVGRIVQLVVEATPGS